MFPALAAARAVQARLYADQVAAGGRDHLGRGRDTAGAARRIAIRHRLGWHELDALDAHTHLDHAEGIDTVGLPKPP